jgi:hypothetical protein
MPLITIITGALLSALGLLGFFLGESRSLTALIPLVLGSILEGCGVLAMKPELKKHAMHGASVVGLLGVLGTAPGAMALMRLLGGSDVARPFAVKIQGVMFVICLVFLVLCIRSFRQARARRLAAS